MRTAIASLRVHGSSGVGCRSNSSITKRVHQLHILESARQLRCGARAAPASPSAYISSPSARVSSGVGRRSCSVITKCAQLPERARQLQCGVPQQLCHHRARTQLRLLESARQLRCGVPQQLVITKRARSSPEGLYLKNADDNIERSRYRSKRRWQTTVVSEIASSLAANTWQTASRLGMYPTTGYRKGRVVVLAKDFPDAGCRINFVRGRTSDEGSNRGFNR